MRAILTLLILGATGGTAPAHAGDIDADLLVYRVEESGVQPYFTRYLITADHLRMDEGDDGGGYTLYDRSSGVIYNVDPEERSVLVIDPPRSLPPPPLDIDLAEETLSAEGFSPLDGAAPARFSLLASGRVCEELIAVAGVMGVATDALADFHDRLAHQHGTVVLGMPDDLVDPCDLAQHVYAPRRPYAFGLPVEQRSARVHRRLVDHAEGAPSDAALFEVPDDFRRLTMPAASPAAED